MKFKPILEILLLVLLVLWAFSLRQPHPSHTEEMPDVDTEHAEGETISLYEDVVRQEMAAEHFVAEAKKK
jgi:hypothetical protein